ncbi:MAG: sensor histidine kinase, partial [Flavobacteriales bacterium]|nr:sensor histidine kinase [Flavobacteriales bacterium]
PRRADASGRLVYASLPAGTYRLLARTLDINGRSSTPVAMARIFKAAPIGQRWWFYWALAMATGGLAYIVSRYRYLQKLRLQQVRDRIASDLHDEVGSSLSAITIGSQLAASLSDQGSPQVKDIVARLGETSSASLRSIRDIVWAIDPKHDEGDALVARMRRIAQELLTDQGVDVSFNITGGVEHLKLPMGARKDLLLLFKEAVHNCSKHAGAGTVQVSLHRRSSRLWLGVKDDGTGFDPALHPDGHGLGSMARRARSLGAELVLKSAPGLGALVAVEVVLTKIRD